MYTNADQLLNKRDLLMMEIVGNEPDLILITEVLPKAQVQPIPPARLEIPGYSVNMNFEPGARNLGTSGKRGICIYVAKHLSASEVELSASSFNEHLWVRVKLQGSNSLLAGCIYRSPASDHTSVRNLCKLLEIVMATKSSHILITGDFNMPEIDWNNILSTAPITHPSHEFLEAVRDSFLIQHVLSPTRYRYGTNPSTLDLVFTNEEGMMHKMESHAGLGNSDHVILRFILSCYSAPPTTQIPKRALNKGNYDRMRELAAQTDWSELDGSSVEDDFKAFQEKLEAISNECIPFQPHRKKRRNLYMTQEAMTLRKRKQKLWRKYVQSQDILDHARYARVRNELRGLTRKLREEYERGLVKNVGQNPKAFWQYSNSRLKTKPRIDDLKQENGPPATTDPDKAQVLSDFFSSVYSREDCSAIPDPVSTFEGIPLDQITITPALVESKLVNLRPTSSPGPDGIHPKILKELAKPLSFPLAALFQKSIDTGELPEVWKTADVVPIYKKGNKQSASNYRPVSLTSVACKVFESVIREALLLHTTSTGQLNKKQHGFLPKRSCVTQLLACMEDWTQLIENGRPVDIIYTDFQKAFDSVPHLRLKRKLLSMGIQGNLLRWLTAFLSERKQRVVINGSRSEWAPVISGIPQGSVLGPTLFLLYINDLPSCVASDVALFADDTKLYAGVARISDRDKLQKDLDEMGTWSQKWQLPFNQAKCCVLHMGPGNPRYQYEMYGTALQSVTEEKDLGVLVDEQLKFKKQAAAAVSKANRILGLIKHSFALLDKTSLPILYKTMVRPHLEYANTIWGPFNMADIRMVERVQRRATRTIPELRHLSYEDRLRNLDLPSLQHRRRRGDMIEVFKIMRDLVDLEQDDFFASPTSEVTRGHSLKIAKPRAQSRARRRHLCVRALNDWNGLPEWVVSSVTLNTFKNNLDKHWAEHKFEAPP